MIPQIVKVKSYVGWIDYEECQVLYWLIYLERLYYISDFKELQL
jgi:hypothetical protein